MSSRCWGRCRRLSFIANRAIERNAAARPGAGGRHPPRRAGEFAADLLPALDGLEIALERARTILARQRHDLVALAPSAGCLKAQMTAATRPRACSTNCVPELRPRKKPVHDPAASSALAPESMAATLSAMEAWLNHLTLVRDRFVTLLALEGIQSMPALNQKFDPRVHMAVDAEIRTDVPPNTVVRELRKGYRQDRRVLRYAEVVIAKAPTRRPLSPRPSPAATGPARKASSYDSCGASTISQLEAEEGHRAQDQRDRQVPHLAALCGRSPVRTAHRRRQLQRDRQCNCAKQSLGSKTDRW